MKSSLLILAASLLNFFSVLQAQDYDVDADQEILDCLYSAEFSNALIPYVFEGYNYEVRVIHNPAQEQLWAEGYGDPISCQCILTSPRNLPFGLELHLENLVYESFGKNKKVLRDLGGIRSFSDKTYAALRPVYVAKTIADKHCDEVVKEAFNSETFTHLLLHYHLNGKYYHVRILHNPQGMNFTASKQVVLEFGKSAQVMTMNWNYKYGIVVDKQAPQELIDHLSALTNASWYDWYFNFNVYNGTAVEYREYTTFGLDVLETTYYLDSWFDYLEELNQA
jgi:hypothetical protein